MHIQDEDFVKYVISMQEKKNTSPSEIHLGIYKAIAQEDLLLRVAFEIMSVALSSNLLLPRWRQMHQILIQKEQSPYIHRLRYVTILEVDVQFLMKQWWVKDLQRDIDKKS